MDDALNQWLGKNNVLIKCIGLKRASQRRQRFQKWASQIRLTFDFWDATDYKDLTPQDLEQWCDVHIGGRQVTGASACRISITKCMLHFLNETNYPFLLIFEKSIL